MNKVFIVGGLRTPIGKTGGAFKKVPPEKLGAFVLNGISEKYNIEPENFDQVILGNSVSPGGNIARVTLLEAGWPESVPGITVDFQCGSGMSAVNLGASQIMSGQVDLILAGGLESTSMAPLRRYNENDPRYNPDQPFYERAPFAPQHFDDPDMGIGAEYLGKLMGISREEMDAQAYLSHSRAIKTKKSGFLKDIMLFIPIADKYIENDESIRNNLTEKLLKRMPPVFVNGGNITAGNACLTHDGAAGVLLASEAAVKKYNLKPEALFIDGLHVGVSTSLFPLAPVEAINKLCSRNGLALDSIDSLEINEAFAVKIIACSKKLGIPSDKVNALGGALAYGHPYGASGCIIVLHLLKSLEYAKGKMGIASIGVGGGTGSGILLERLCYDENS